jgi:glutathione synthase/RimK-type ligase-like ATP-grasp enzyme
VLPPTTNALAIVPFMGRSRTCIGIIGPLHFPQCESVARALSGRGTEVLAVDSRAPLPIVWTDTGARVLGRSLDEIDGAYVLAIPPRQPVLAERMRAGGPGDDVTAAEWADGLERGHAARDVVVAVLDGLVKRGRPVLNPPTGGDFIQLKLQDLSDARALGLQVPDTVVTSDIDALRAFISRARDEGGEVLTKPVRGGAAARLVDDAPVSKEPVLLQRRVSGDDVRVLMLDDELLIAAALPPSREVDHRENAAYRAGHAAYQAIAIDDDTRTLLRQLMALRGLRFVGVDLKRHADGRFTFLEMNAAPIFEELAIALDVDVAGALAETLVQDPSRAR